MILFWNVIPCAYQLKNEKQNDKSSHKQLKILKLARVNNKNVVLKTW